MNRHDWKYSVQARACRGFSVVEVLLGAALFAVFASGAIALLLQGLQADRLAEEESVASNYASEGLEALRSMKNQSFASLTTTASSGIDRVGSGGVWAFSGASTSYGKYVRTVSVAPVSRDGNGNVVASGGTNDPLSRKVTSTVTWPVSVSRINALSFVSYLTDWHLPVSSGGDWTNPTQIASLDAPGTNNGIKIRSQGNFIYMIRPSGSPNFLIIDVSNPANPVMMGSLTLTGTPTNIALSGGLAAVSNKNNNQELQMVNVATPSSPSVVGTFNIPGGENASGVFMNGTMVYVVRASGSHDEFVAVSVATPSAPTLVGSMNLNANGNEVITSGNFAYVASANDTQEVQVVNISTPSSPSLAGSLNLSGTADATTVSLAGTTLLVGRGSDLYTIDVSTPESPVLLGSVNVSDTLNDIALTFGNSNTLAFLATSSDVAEFQVVNISSPSSPSVVGSVDVASNNNLFGVAYSGTLDRAFGVGASNAEEFVVFAPQ
ncbi:MAG: hypothetical protein IPJ67_03785 [Candidatus Moraniibacteriota bacterium]|nr:MAG: hypothetical protein IPJ67_03785 [Candidatus Moranbacteria bacterium]